MIDLLGTVQKKMIRIERMKIHRILPPANRNLHPANRVKNMKKLQRNSPFAGLKVNPWICSQKCQENVRIVRILNAKFFVDTLRMHGREI